MAAKEQIFKTKTGYCHILEDKIVLTRTGKIENLEGIKVKENSPAILLVYAVIAIGLLFSAYTNFQTGQNFFALLFGGVGVLLINGIVRSINFSGTPLIIRADIISTEFKKGVWGFTRDRFEIMFTDSKGNPRKRLILLPGSFIATKESLDEAMEIMKNSGLMSKSQSE
ncbi:MAG: phosphoribosylaminoimidazolesuccinocarboxamide synthase [Flavobacteriales bacterium]|nr:phosphoribosylaminoimidazolesuccinocarboxamide synthase [Flavobacteriales bacterium]